MLPRTLYWSLRSISYSLPHSFNIKCELQSYGSSSSSKMSILGAKKTFDSTLAVDLRSDTQTAPCLDMRKSMADAVVGDDVYGEDPTISDLESKVAAMAGMQAGLFVPSGTMGNLISIMVHCPERGAEIILGDESHIHLYEQGNIAQIGGIHSRCVRNLEDGTFDLSSAESLIRGDDIHYPVSRVLVIENTHNKAGGKALPLSWIRSAHELCSRRGLKLHCDAARIFNAGISSGCSIGDILSPWCDSASICLSKGLGAPIGSVIVGRKDFISRCRRLRKALGGGMRQVGVLGNAGLFAINNNVEKLWIDHQRCYSLAKAINDLESSKFHCPLPDSNILMIHIEGGCSASDLVSRFLEIPEKERKDLGNNQTRVHALEFSQKRVRLVFHLSISEKECARAVEKVLYVLREMTTTRKEVEY